LAPNSSPTGFGTSERDDSSQVRALARTCVLFALPDERKALKWQDTEFLTIDISGTGYLNAARACERVVRASRPELLILCGFAGALRPGMRPGDLVISTHVSGTGPDGNQLPDPIAADLECTRAACDLMEAHPGTHIGKLYSAPRVLVTADEKASCVAAYGADAVDMETAAAAAIAAKLGVPWVSVRAITDDANSNLPLDFNALAGANGNTDMGLLLKALARRPAAIPGLIQLGKNAAAAGKALASFLQAYIPAVYADMPGSANGE
jgi:adenosylhomocysteine nucleosidase